MKKFIATLVSLVVLGLFGACNTIEGVGKDLSKAGDKIEEAAKKK